MEAAACGVPSIATGWGAHTDFLHEGIGYPLQVRGTVPAVARCPYYAGFSWADPDVDHLRNLLRTAFEDGDETRRRGSAAAEEVRGAGRGGTRPGASSSGWMPFERGRLQ